MTRRGRPERPTSPVLNIDLANMGTLHGYAVEVHRVMAVMLFPNDRTARSSFVMSAAYDHLSRCAALISPPGSVSIVNKPREIEVRPTERIVTEALMPRLHFKGGNGSGDGYLSGPSVAATILRRAFVMAHAGYPELGIMRVIAEQGEVYRADGIVGAGRDRLTEIWTEYRSVAHIAAAWAALKDRSLQDHRAFFDWLGLASDILKEASGLGSRFAASILPPNDSWHVVLTPTALGRGVPRNSSDRVFVTSRAIGSE